MRNFNNDDRELLVQLYMLTPEELKQAERMYYRTTISVCACGKAVAKKRPSKQE